MLSLTIVASRHQIRSPPSLLSPHQLATLSPPENRNSFEQVNASNLLTATINLIFS